MEKDQKKLNEDMKELLEKLKEATLIDMTGNPFVVVPKKELIELKNHIEEFSSELAPKLDSEK